MAALGGEAEIQYPVPLCVHNTFIEAQTGRPDSLDGFFQERQVFSCPGSRILSTDSEPGSEPRPAAPRRTPYAPGEQLMKSAAFGSGAPLAMHQADESKEGTAALEKSGKAMGTGGVGVQTPPDHDSRSECSTADTGSTGGGNPGSCCPPSPQLRAPAAGVPVLRLEEALQGSQFKESASRGSEGHGQGECKPCAFYHTRGCEQGKGCEFCHLCPKGEKQRRQKDKRAFFGAMRSLQRMASESWPFGGQVQEQGPVA